MPQVRKLSLCWQCCRGGDGHWRNNDSCNFQAAPHQSDMPGAVVWIALTAFARQAVVREIVMLRRAFAQVRNGVPAWSATLAYVRLGYKPGAAPRVTFVALNLFDKHTSDTDYNCQSRLSRRGPEASVSGRRFKSAFAYRKIAMRYRRISGSVGSERRGKGDGKTALQAEGVFTPETLSLKHRATSEIDMAQGYNCPLKVFNSTRQQMQNRTTVVESRLRIGAHRCPTHAE